MAHWGRATLATSSVMMLSLRHIFQEVLVVNDDNPHYSTRGGEDTMDRVFLLSEAELLEFFPEQEQRTCQATEYAKAQGA